ncbi:MAG: lipopolysaccharide heptosyltransferase I [Gammaproteobacteria bacterium]
MRVLLIKMSSLGDVVHALAAVTDAQRALPDVRFDWVVEEAFSEVPAWHPAVDQVIPIAQRRWRRDWAGSRDERRAFRKRLRAQRYDLVLDAQGLIKSAVVARLARGPRAGLNRHSAREPLAALAYRQRIDVPKGQHAVVRLRALFAAALGYPVPQTPVDYGIARDRLPAVDTARQSLVFLHGTTWPSKQWPESYWKTLAGQAASAGLEVLLPWGSDAEHERARRIAEISGARVLPRLGLSELAATIAAARGVVGVDTGLAHLAAALSVPAVILYGATRPALTGTYGENQIHLNADFPCSPCLRRECRYTAASSVRPACYEAMTPERVWRAMASHLRIA